MKALARLVGPVPGYDHPIELQDLLLEAEQLSAERGKASAGNLRHPFVARVGNNTQQFRDSFAPDRGGRGQCLQRYFGSVKEIPVIVGMASRHLFELAAFSELLEGVGACGLVQPMVRDHASGLRRHQRLRDEVGQGADRFRCGDLATRRYQTRRLCRKVAGENGKPPQHLALGLWQQFIAPV